MDMLPLEPWILGIVITGIASSLPRTGHYTYAFHDLEICELAPGLVLVLESSAEASRLRGMSKGITLCMRNRGQIGIVVLDNSLVSHWTTAHLLHFLPDQDFDH